MTEAPRGEPASQEAAVQEMGEEECLRLIGQREIGRIAYNGRFGPTVLPVNYRMYEGSIVFRTSEHSSLDEDLRTGIENAEYKVAFEVDDLDPAAHEGWSVLIQGSAHHVTEEEERAEVAQTGVRPWPGGRRDLFMRVLPTRITGRHVGRGGAAG